MQACNENSTDKSLAVIVRKAKNKLHKTNRMPRTVNDTKSPDILKVYVCLTLRRNFKNFILVYSGLTNRTCISANLCVSAVHSASLPAFAHGCHQTELNKTFQHLDLQMHFQNLEVRSFQKLRPRNCTFWTVFDNFASSRISSRLGVIETIGKRRIHNE